MTSGVEVYPNSARSIWPMTLPSPSCGRIALTSNSVCVPTLMSPISMNSWTAWLSRPAAMNTSATPVQRKKVARLIRREPW